MDALAHEAALHVGERDDDRVDRAALDLGRQLLQRHAGDPNVRDGLTATPLQSVVIRRLDAEEESGMSTEGPSGAATTPRTTRRSSTSSATRRSSSGRWAGSATSRSRFTIISILAGCLTSYNIGFEHGGPMWVTWGWLLVGLMSTIIALAMAEIASAYPTAGGLYYWASKLGSPGLGLGDRLVQPHRPGRGHRGDRVRARALRAGALRLLVLVHRAHERLVRRVVRRLDLHPVRALPDRGGAHQLPQHPPHVGPEHDLRVVAHGRRRRHRRRS